MRHLTVARLQHPLQLAGIDQRLAGDLVHPPRQRPDTSLDDEVLPLVHERLHRRRHPAARAPQHLAPVAIGEVGVLL